MKIKRNQAKFRPITITLETKQELTFLVKSLHVILNDITENYTKKEIDENESFYFLQQMLDQLKELIND